MQGLLGGRLLRLLLLLLQSPVAVRVVGAQGLVRLLRLLLHSGGRLLRCGQRGWHERLLLRLAGLPGLPDLPTRYFGETRGGDAGCGPRTRLPRENRLEMYEESKSLISKVSEKEKRPLHLPSFRLTNLI